MSTTTDYVHLFISMLLSNSHHAIINIGEIPSAVFILFTGQGAPATYRTDTEFDLALFR